MPSSEQDLLETASIMRQMLDDLAARLILDDGKWSGPWIEELTSILARIGAMAELTGRPDIRSLSLPLEQRAARVRRGDDEPGAFAAALQSGIVQLQEAVERTGAASSTVETAVRPPVNALAQDRELVSDFILEAREHLANIEAQLLALEENPGALEPIHSIFRGFHTIKGLAGFLEFAAIQEVAHEVETLLDLARNGRVVVAGAVVDAVLAGADYLGIEINRVERELNGAPAEPATENGKMLEAIRSLMRPPAPGATPDEKAKSAGPDLAALSKSILASEHSKAEERSAAQDARSEKKGAAAVKVDTAKLDSLVDMVGEMVIADSILRHTPELAELKSTRVLRALTQIERMTSEVQKTAMSMRMVTIGQLFQKMARLVRDTSRKQAKQVELVTAGEDTELDRNIVEELGDPLMHMVRNAIDHGIETPEQRQAAGKDPTAKLTLSAAHRGGHICIEVSDDGRGLNKEKILAKARQKGLVQDADHLSDSEIFNLIFEPGFSTADQVTDISGRGVGMDVVRKRIQKLRGRVEIQSTPGRGSTFMLKLPLTLAIIDGLVVGVGKERYVVPVFAVKEMLRPGEDMLFTVENRDEMALVRGRLFPVVRLCRRFGVAPRSDEAVSSVLILVESAGKDFCVMVDEVIGKQEVVIKSLGPTMQRIAGVAGGAILGDGRVGLILDLEGVYLEASGA
ncbi:MAG TPA: chemotaxis protein CheA [Bryobacteraceae bacterium]|nr:chemotaxis protein CheA [Bryobacteraceae bacterium]